MASYSKDITIPYTFVEMFANAPDSDVDCSPDCRGLLVRVGGTLNVTMANGDELDDLPVQAGRNAGRFAAVRTGGTAQGIWEIL